MRSDFARGPGNESTAWQKYVDITFLAANCIILLSTSLVGIGANVFVTWAVYHQKTLQTWNNALLVNLAVVDLLRCAVDCPIILAIVLTVHQRGRADGTVCIVQMASFSFSCCIQLVTLACISAERYQAIAFPFKIAERKKRIITFIPLTWAFGILVAAFCVAFVKDSPVYVKCHGSRFEATYHYDTFGLYVLIPLWTACFALITGFYARIFSIVTAHSRKIFDKGVNLPSKEAKKEKVAEAKKAEETPEGSADKKQAAGDSVAQVEKVELSKLNVEDSVAAPQKAPETVTVLKAPHHDETVAQPTTDTDKPPDENLQKQPKPPALKDGKNTPKVQVLEVVSSKMEVVSPKMEVVSPKIEMVSPKMEVVSPKMEVMSPKMEVLSSKMEVVSPKMEMVSPKMEVVSPKMEMVSPKMEVVSPKMEVVSPKMEMVSPKMEVVSPKMEVVSPKMEVVSSKMEVVSSEMEKKTTARPVIQVQAQLPNKDTEAHQDRDKAPGKGRDKSPIQGSKSPALMTVALEEPVPSCPSHEPGGSDEPSVQPLLTEPGKDTDKAVPVAALAAPNTGDNQELSVASVARKPAPDAGDNQDLCVVSVSRKPAPDEGDNQDLCVVSVSRKPAPDTGDNQDLCVVSVSRKPAPDEGDNQDLCVVSVSRKPAPDEGDNQDLCVVSVARKPAPDEGGAGDGAVCMMPSRGNKDRGNKKKESKLAKRSGYIILTFLLFWLPLITTIVANVLLFPSSQSETKIIQDVEILFISIACMTSLTNPIIYAAVNPQFKTEFYRLRNKVKSLWKKR
ncbi:hypothetical protein NHX12_003579 [Muraenolepis orangiensis]|uniref:G-protein coupled receptors family 1 profile domain-containing protein n=1 Tax=Muraenolepis orangiensis TaxID=630683 RepID=A0A9Q0DZB3_9TELE|nr:hypothetical protein NHX12_003579 [Muraenolepis orangiensis]